MQVADLQVIRDIPGFKVILKAILKSQIQQMVEQLAEYTGEESVLLTASVSDGSLSHLGSESGKVFLEDHDDIKSQFLGFCLKRYHRQKQLELTSKDDLLDPTGGLRPGARSPRKFGPGSKQRVSRPHIASSNQVDVHPIALTKSGLKPVRGTPKSVRQDPYPVSIPRNSAPVPVLHRSVEPVLNLALNSIQMEPMEKYNANLNETSEIRETVNVKVEAVDEVSQSEEQSDRFSNSQTSSHSPHGQYSTPDTTEYNELPTPTESGFHSANNVNSEAQQLSPAESEPTLNNEPELSNMSRNSVEDTDSVSFQSSVDQREIKIEAISESDMELEITGVESGNLAHANDNWVSNIQDVIGSIPSSSGINSVQGELTPALPNHGNSPSHQGSPTMPLYGFPPVANFEGDTRGAKYNADHKKVGMHRLLPESATQVMKTWLFRNVMNPYPPEDVKREMARQTNLNLVQINNWFTNARRRIIQPMLEANNTDEAVERLARYTSHHRTWGFGPVPEGVDRPKAVKTPTRGPGSNPNPIVYSPDGIRPRYDPDEPNDLSMGNKS